jgi:hypothetical protein
VRKLSLLVIAALTLGGAGCGKGGPAGPPNLTQEQIEAGNKEQKKVDGEERAHQKAEPAAKKGPGNSAEDEERRARNR